MKSVVTRRLLQKPSRSGVGGVREGGFETVTYALGGGRVLSGSKASIFGAEPDVFPEGVKNLDYSRLWGL